MLQIKERKQSHLDNAFIDQYNTTLELASYFDEHGTALDRRLTLKLSAYEDKIVLFKSFCDQYQDTHATINFKGQQVTIVAALSIIGDFVHRIREATFYGFPKLG